MTAPLYLHKLPLLGELFAFLNSGKHLNRMAEPQLWAELERERDAYQQIFTSLGCALRIDARGLDLADVDAALLLLVVDAAAVTAEYLGDTADLPDVVIDAETRITVMLDQLG